MYAMLYYLGAVLSQEEVTSQAEAALQSDALTIGTFIASMAAIILVMARIVGPAIANRFKDSQEIATKRNEHEFEQDKLEDELSLEAKSFLAEQARDSMEAVRSTVEEYRAEVKELRKENHKYLTELGELRVSDKIRQNELTRLLTEVQEYKENLTWTKDALSSSQAEMSRMQSQIHSLERQIDTLQKRAKVLEENLQTQEEANQILEEQVTTANAKLEERELELVEIKTERNALRDLVNKLRAKMWQYRHKLGDELDPPTDMSKYRSLDTSELLGLNGGDEDDED